MIKQIPNKILFIVSADWLYPTFSPSIILTTKTATNEINSKKIPHFILLFKLIILSIPTILYKRTRTIYMKIISNKK